MLFIASVCILSLAATAPTGHVTISLDGRPLVALDDQGTYFVDLEKLREEWPDVPLPEVSRSLFETSPDGAAISPVLVELEDFVECTGNDHGFSDENVIASSPHPNKPSRLLERSGRTFRVTAAPDDGFATYYYRYEVSTGPAGTPHLLMAESVNDQERYTSLVLNAPAGSSWGPPYEGEPAAAWGEPAHEHNIRRIQQGDSFYPDVGITFYTGRELAIDDRLFNMHAVFYPKAPRTQVAVTSLACNLERGPDDGGAVSRIWVWRILSSLADRGTRSEPGLVDRDGQRHVGIYMPHSWFLYAHYGTPHRTESQRVEGLRRLCQHLVFCGLDWLEFNAINGSDRTGHAWYRGSDLFPSKPAGDLLAELPPVAEQEGVWVVPVITSLTEPRETMDLDWSEASFQIGSDGRVIRLFGRPAPDPLRPEVQETMARLLDEIAVRCRDHASVAGIGFRVNGKLGLCYCAGDDGTRGSRHAGYSHWNLEQFAAASGLDIPVDDAARAYAWLNDPEHPERWQAWIDYRCRKTREFWLALRDRVRGYRPDWDLFVKCVLPSETPGTNIEYAEGEEPVELLRHAGYDPALYRAESGIVIERTVMVAEDRFYCRTRWLPPWGAHHDNYRDFHYAPGIVEAYRTAEGAALDLYFNYWEEAGNPFFEYGSPGDPNGFFRTTSPTPYNRNFFRPMTTALHRNPPDLIVLTGWQRGTLGHEHRLRRFAQAFRSIPRVSPRPFDGILRPETPDVHAAWFGDRLVLTNDSASERVVHIGLDPAATPGHALWDTTYSRVWHAEQTGAGASLIPVPMEPWSIRVLTVPITR